MGPAEDGALILSTINCSCMNCFFMFGKDGLKLFMTNLVTNLVTFAPYTEDLTNQIWQIHIYKADSILIPISEKDKINLSNSNGMSVGCSKLKNGCGRIKTDATD